MSSQRKHIEVVSYNSDWPKMFEAEAAKIRDALGNNHIAVHHIGSTSVPGMASKSVIDIITVIKDREKAILSLEALGYQHKGEYNIPLRLYFNKKEGGDVNLHVYEEDHPEIELNLLFRGYLRTHPEVRDGYAKIKDDLLKAPSSFEKNNSLFVGYTLGKHAFIQEVLRQVGFKRIRLMRCTHDLEWEAAKLFRQKYFFDKISIADPYTWTFDHPDHVHFALYQGVDIIGYAHLELWPKERAAIRIIVIDEAKRCQGFGEKFLTFLEGWLKSKGYKSVHAESSPQALGFYKRHGYVDMLFQDPGEHELSPKDIPVGKIL